MCVCSTTTMAASTIAPMAIAMPPSDMMFDVSPIILIGMNAMMMAIGIVTIGMMALGTCQRKIRMTSATMISSSISVLLQVVDGAQDQLASGRRP